MSDGAVFAAAALTLVLLVSGLSKLRSPENFRRALATYRAIPARAVSSLVVAVPGVELSFALAQWVPALSRVAGMGLCAMFGAFTLLLLHSLLTGQESDCGCFGSATHEPVSWFSVLRNAVLIGLAVMGLVAGDGAARGTLPAALAGTGAGVLILLLDQAQTMFSGEHVEPPGRG
jgi:uncharacterized protein YjeT (DUF2065 family)